MPTPRRRVRRPAPRAQTPTTPPRAPRSRPRNQEHWHGGELLQARCSRCQAWVADQRVGWACMRCGGRAYYAPNDCIICHPIPTEAADTTVRRSGDWGPSIFDSMVEPCTVVESADGFPWDAPALSLRPANPRANQPQQAEPFKDEPDQ